MGQNNQKCPKKKIKIEKQVKQAVKWGITGSKKGLQAVKKGLQAVKRRLQPVKIGVVRFKHKLKSNKTTDIDSLNVEIQRHVDAWNKILKKNGMKGLKNRLRTYERHKKMIERAGRKYTKSLGSAGKGKIWSHYPDMSGGGMPKSGVDVLNPANARLNSIIGGQMNRIRRELLKMSDDITKLIFELIIN